MSESTTFSDYFTSLGIIVVRINHFFGLLCLAWDHCCPNQPLFRTTLPRLGSLLSELTAFSDYFASLGVIVVRINHFFGLLCLAWDHCCPNQPLFRTTLSRLGSLLSELTTFSDYFASLGFIVVRINHFFGLLCLAWSHCCPNQLLFRTTLPRLGSLLSESTTFSDYFASLGVIVVRINCFFGLFCLAWSHCCPNQPLFQTTLPRLGSLLSELTPFSDYFASLGIIVVRINCFFGLLCLAWGHCCPNQQNFHF
ncbi:hypothetical protein J2T56_001859 [Natronobacillus azotifigens]